MLTCKMDQNGSCSFSHAKIKMDHTSLAELSTSKGIGWGSLSVFLLDLAKAFLLKGFHYNIYTSICYSFMISI